MFPFQWKLLEPILSLLLPTQVRSSSLLVLRALIREGVGEELLHCGGAHKPTHYDFGDGTVHEIVGFHDSEGVLSLLLIFVCDLQRKSHQLE